MNQSATAPPAIERSGEATAIVVRQQVFDELLSHARQEAPNECCGVLLGQPGVVTTSMRARNSLQSPTRYLIDAEDHFAALRQARLSGLSVVGFYHSHPASAPEPSARDREEAAYPGHLYLIVFPGSGRGPAEIRGFKLQEDGNFGRVTLVPSP